MDRWLLLGILAYAPHLLEEHLTGMWNDPLIVLAFAPLEDLPARQAAYLIFQVMLGLSLLMTYVFSQGDGGRRLILGGLALSLLCESHHVLRALATEAYNPGLLTVLPMPLLGAWILHQLFLRSEPAKKVAVCGTPS